MPLILWLLGAPLGLIIVLWLLHVIYRAELCALPEFKHAATRTLLKRRAKWTPQLF